MVGDIPEIEFGVKTTELDPYRDMPLSERPYSAGFEGVVWRLSFEEAALDLALGIGTVPIINDVNPEQRVIPSSRLNLVANDAISVKALPT